MDSDIHSELYIQNNEFYIVHTKTQCLLWNRPVTVMVNSLNENNKNVQFTLQIRINNKIDFLVFIVNISNKKLILIFIKNQHKLIR